MWPEIDQIEQNRHSSCHVKSLQGNGRYKDIIHVIKESGVGDRNK